MTNARSLCARLDREQSLIPLAIHADDHEHDPPLVARAGAQVYAVNLNDYPAVGESYATVTLRPANAECYVRCWADFRASVGNVSHLAVMSGAMFWA